MAQNKNSKALQKALGALDEFRREVEETPPEELDSVELETRLQQVLNRIGCECMRSVVQRADSHAPLVKYGGEVWGNRRESPGRFVTIFGEFEEPRGIYSKPGGGPVLVPVDMRLNIVERRYTPRVARVMTRAIAVMTTGEAEGLLHEAGVVQVSRSTLDRVPKTVAARYEAQRDSIEQAIREQDAVPDAAVVVQAGLDGVMVPQDGETAKPRGRKTTCPQPPRHEQRYETRPTTRNKRRAACSAANNNEDEDGGEEGRAWHEAAVGTVAFWDADGELLKTTYLARMPEPGMQTVTVALDDEIRRVLAERPGLDVCFASDGDAHQWAMLEGIAAGLTPAPGRRESFNLDVYHAGSYLSKAASAATTDDDAAYVLAENWKTTLVTYKDGAARVLKSMRYHRDRARSATRRQTIVKCLSFLAKQAQKGRMRYQEERAMGHPIGTGVTEAAAKTLVNVRMKRAGARYDDHGGQTILTFRAALYSERFDALWDQLRSSYSGTVHDIAA